MSGKSIDQKETITTKARALHPQAQLPSGASRLGAAGAPLLTALVPACLQISNYLGQANKDNQERRLLERHTIRSDPSSASRLVLATSLACAAPADAPYWTALAHAN